MRPIRWIVVHTSATADKSGIPVDASVEQMRAYHKTHNGWNDVGYHFVVRFDGTVEKGRDVAQVGAHVGGFNGESIGICVSGHGDLQPFKLAQRKALAELCARLCNYHGLDPIRVIGHREADEHGAPHVDKTCPGKLVDMGTIRADAARAITGQLPAAPAPLSAPELGAFVSEKKAALPDRVDSLELRVTSIETLLDIA